MKKILYHGTTHEAYLDILKNGFQRKIHIWICSDDYETYFFDEEKMIETYGCEEDEKESECIVKAFESAQLSASVINSQSEYLYVFKFVVDDEEFDVQEDYSCENMADFAVCMSNNDINEILSRNNHKIFRVKGYSPSLRLFILNNIYPNKMEPINEDFISDVEKKIMKNIDNSGICIYEDIFELLTDYEKIKNGDLK